MLDLETMSTKPNAALVAIGAVVFNAENVIGKFYRAVDLQSSMDARLDVEAGTVAWWSRQSDEARAVLTDPDAGHLHYALEGFQRWLGDIRHINLNNFDDILIWGNGANFDNVILRSAYSAAGYDAPWSPFNDRCYRTIKSGYPDIKLERTGTHHNAENDAESQANHLIAINAAKN